MAGIRGVWCRRRGRGVGLVEMWGVYSLRFGFTTSYEILGVRISSDISLVQLLADGTY